MAEEMDDDDGGSDSDSESENAIELLDHGRLSKCLSRNNFNTPKRNKPSSTTLIYHFKVDPVDGLIWWSQMNLNDP